MNESKKPSDNTNNIKTDGEILKETDAMGREKFWEDIGRP